MNPDSNITGWPSPLGACIKNGLAKGIELNSAIARGNSVKIRNSDGRDTGSIAMLAKIQSPATLSAGRLPVK
jgi:hypothetical protein